MRIRIDLKIFLFIILFYLTRQIEIYATIMIFCIIHELGHIIAGFAVGLKPEKIEIMPYGITVSFVERKYKRIYPGVGNNNDIKRNNKKNQIYLKKLFVAIAGPLTNLIIILFTYKVNISFIEHKETVIFANMLILAFNLLPIYPLDGGRIIKCILNLTLGRKDELINKISYITVIAFTVLSSICIYYYKNIAFFVISLFLWGLVIRENKRYKLNKRMWEVINK